MLQKRCPQCGGQGKLDSHIHAHEFHVGHQLQEFFKNSTFFRSHPLLALGGTVGLGVAAVIKAVEGHFYECPKGHRFK